MMAIKMFRNKEKSGHTGISHGAYVARVLDNRKKQ